ncbi:MAG: nuclear transport factor 2 family protein [Bacteroidota bacterium]
MKIIRLGITALITVFCIASCGQVASSTQGSPLSADDEEKLRAFKTELWGKAYDEQDTVLLSKLLHENFLLVDDNGDTYSKADEIEYISNYPPSYSTFEYEIDRIQIFDNGTAVVFGKGIMKGEDADGVYITTYKSSNTLIKVDGDWQAINSHVSGVKEERIQDAPSY